MVCEFVWIRGQVSQLKCTITVMYMKRLAFQSDFLSNRCDVY
jgi:hypothetical protein